MASVSICFTAGCLPAATCAHSRLCRAHVRALVGSIAPRQVRCSPVGLPGSPPASHRGGPAASPSPPSAVWSLRPCPGSSGFICSFSIRLCFLERLHGCGENGVPNQESWPRLSVRRHGLARGPRPSSSGPRQGDLAAPSRLRRCRHRHPPGPTPPPAPLLL